MARFKSGSRYTNGKFTLTKDKEEFLILRGPLEIPESGQDIFLTLEGKFEKRPDLISQEVYNRPDLGWVIMEINRIRQPMFDLSTGTVLRIPPLTLVLEAIERMNQEV